MSFELNFSCTAQPFHADATSSRSQKDLKIILFGGQTEVVDSEVMATHSGTISGILSCSRRPYKPIDMSHFDEKAVHLVIDWMYSGEINFSMDQMRNVLSVASNWRVSGLQRQLEEHLEALALHGQAVLALNTATADSFTVSNDSIKSLALSLQQIIGDLYTNDIADLSYNSIIALMSSKINAREKVPLINLAISWMKYHKTEIEAKKTICESVTFIDRDGETIHDVQQGLIYHTGKNDYNRRLVIDTFGRLSFRDRTRVNSSSVNKFTNSKWSLARPPQPQPPARQNPTWQARENRRGLAMVSTSDQNVNEEKQQQQKQQNSDYSTFESTRSSASTSSLRNPRNPRRSLFRTQSQLEDLRQIPDTFENPYFHQFHNRPIEASSSIRDQIANMPNPFQNSNKKNKPAVRSQDSISDVSNSNPNPYIIVDPIVAPTRQASDPERMSLASARKILRQHNLDHENLNTIADPFGQQQQHQIRRQNSDQENINAIANPFDRKQSLSNSKHKVLTKSQTEFLKDAEDPFQNTKPQRQFSLTDSSQKKKVLMGRRQNFDQSEIEHLQSIPNPFQSPSTNKSEKKTHATRSQRLYP
ncbi:unnamed protein product [Caenorhabditis angaria]|uniref:BTB domain-containing protein n=1 Tax=Caenorhabditis angaria TaxID=860376 RepID=A0A9P1N9A5_9PELO|nr:unnamed protein product [Caenorhabditis angaria]